MGVLGGSAYAMGGLFRPGWPLPAMFCMLVVAGFFTSFQFTAYNTIAYDEVPRGRMSSATSLYSTLQQITLSLGVCLAATILHVGSAAQGRVTPSLANFSVAFWAVAAVGLCSIFANRRFPSDAGMEMSGAGQRPAA